MSMNNVAALAILAVAIGIIVGYFMGYLTARMKVPLERKDAIRRSRSTLSGQFSEQLAPFLPDFPFKPTEARFMGKPIDFLIFKGMDERNISEVVFLEVKSGKSHLSGDEQALQSAILAKKVSWQEYRVPEEITKKPLISLER